MRRVLFPLLALVVALCGCRYEADLDVAADGSGQGHIAVFDPPPGATTGDAERQLRRAGFVVSNVASPSPQRIDADIAWTDFAKVFRRRVVNEDGSVTLDFGPIDQGRLLARVHGRIDFGDTSGQRVSNERALFTRGRGRLTYVPSSPWPWIALAGGALLLLVILGLAWWLSHRAGTRPALDSASGGGRTPS